MAGGKDSHKGIVMRRSTPFVWRAAIAVTVFVLTVGAFGAAHVVAFEAIEQRAMERIAIAVLLLLWCLVGYFPTRWAYLSLTFKHFGDGIHCDGCGYDLTGNRSGRCPECGRQLWKGWLRLSKEQRDSDAQVTRERIPGIICGHFATWCACVMFAIGCVAVWTLRDAAPDYGELQQVVDRNLQLVQWDADSSMHKMEPNSVFVMIDGVMRARFTFASADRITVESIGVTDVLGRPWIEADLWNGQTLFNHYRPGQSSVDAEPDVTYIDSDGDYFPDRLKDWMSGVVSCSDATPNWGACPEPTEERQDSLSVDSREDR
jgi:hypothetical protein